MKKTRTGIMAAAAALIALTGFAGDASAAVGIVDHSIRLRAGPGRDYPTVAMIPANVRMDIRGCISGWQWCDVNVGSLRGWISSGSLRVVHDRRRISVYDAGPRFGLSVVLFNQDDYWDTYYSNRPFYRDWRRTHPRHHDNRDWHHDRDHDHDHDHDNDHDWHDNDHHDHGHWNN